MSKRLDYLRARRDRSNPAQQDEFYRLNALEDWGVTLPEKYEAASFVLYLEPDDSGGMVAQLANSRAAQAVVRDGELWLQSLLATVRATPEGAPRLATGMSKQAARYLQRLR